MEGNGYLTCPFCGQASAKRSYGDEEADTGRLELYCTNDNCQAREITVLVMRDSYQAHTRADVRILHAIDEEITTLVEDDERPTTMDLRELMAKGDEALAPRRQNTADIVAAARGIGEGLTVD